MTLETKFNVGDKVWTIFKNKPEEMKVSKISIRIYKDAIYIDCDLSTGCMNDSPFECDERYVFATKADLLAFWA